MIGIWIVFDGVPWDFLQLNFVKFVHAIMFLGLANFMLVQVLLGTVLC